MNASTPFPPHVPPAAPLAQLTGVEVGLTVALVVAAVGAAAAAFLLEWRGLGRGIPDRALARAAGRRCGALRVASRDLPAFRFVDLHRAAAAVAGERAGGRAGVLDRADGRRLAEMLAGRNRDGRRPASPAPRTARPVGAGDGGPAVELIPDDRFWVVSDPGGPRSPSTVVRVWYGSDYGPPRANVEVAAPTFEAAQALLDAVEKRSVADSIFRGALLEFRHQGSYDEEGEFGGGGEPDLTFKPKRRLAAADIVLDPDTLPVLRRNLVDHRARHADLKRLGLPLSKGLLFHGPPGTGKTYTCRWVVGEMPDTTAFVVAGQSLHHVKSVCGLAKLYAPSLVILEDVDLVFTEREMNPHVSALGDLMDEMDGFRPDEAVSFILTTNALDRVERAIRDRPGRIGQCVLFGPPDAELRRRYLAQYLQPFDASAVDPAALAADSRGCSQAFLKEWIARAALFALEDDARREAAPLPLTPADFAAALAELTRGGERGGAVVGFGGASDR